MNTFKYHFTALWFYAYLSAIPLLVFCSHLTLAQDDQTNISSNLPLGINEAVSYAKGFQLAVSLSQATEDLYASHGLNKEWVMDLTSTRIKNTSTNEYEVRLINEETATEQWITTKEGVFSRYRDTMNQALEDAEIPSKAYPNDNARLTGALKIDAPKGIASALFIKGLFDFLRGETHVPMGNDSTNIQLYTAIKLHTYVKLIQGGVDVTRDILKVVNIVKVLRSGAIEEVEIIAKVDAIAGKIGLGLGAINVIIDIVELVSADTPEQRAILGTQLGFDSAGLGLAGASYGLGLIGAGTAAGFAGALAVPLAGIGIGVTALVQAWEKADGEALNNALYFLNCDQSYKTPIKQEVTSQGTPYLNLANQAVITSVSLSDDQQATATLGTQYVYRTATYYKGGYKNSSHTGTNWAVKDKSKAVPVRLALGYDDDKVEVNAEGINALVLPVTPVSYIYYRYGPAWGIYRRDDAQLRVVRRMADNYPFLFLYWGPDENAIRDMTFEYDFTNIDIQLGASNQALLSPKIPDFWHGKIQHSIFGKGGSYSLSVADGITYQINTGSSEETWLIDAASFDSSSARYDNGTIFINNIKIKLSGDFNDLQFKFADGFQSFNTSSKSFDTISLDEDKWAAHHKNQSLIDFLASESQKERHVGYIKVIGHPSDEDPSFKGIAWYDNKNEKFIVPNLRLQQTIGTALELIGVKPTGERFYFVDGRVGNNADTEVQTLLILEDPKLAEGFTMLNFPDNAYPTNVGFNGNFITAELSSGVTLAIKDTKKMYITGIDAAKISKGFNSQKIKSFTLANAIKIYSSSDPNSKIKQWIIPETTDSTLKNPSIKGELVRLKWDNEAILLLGWETAGQGSNRYFFFDPEKKKLYIQTGTQEDSYNFNQTYNTPIPEPKPVTLKGLIQAYSVGQQIFAHTDSGNILRVDASAGTHFSGIWLSQNQHQGANLRALLTQQDSDPVVELIGAHNAQGKPIVAWFDTTHDAFITAIRTEGSENTTLVGFNDQNNQAYLLNQATGSLYSHQVETGNIDEFSLDFSGSKPKLKDAGDSNYSPKKINIDGFINSAYLSVSGVVAISNEGVIYHIDSDNQAALVAVTDSWLSAQDDNQVGALSELAKLYPPSNLNPYINLGAPSKSTWFDATNSQILRSQPVSIEKRIVDQTLLGYDLSSEAIYTFSQELHRVYKTINGVTSPYINAKLAKVFGANLLVISQENTSFTPPSLNFDSLIFVSNPKSSSIHISASDFAHYNTIYLKRNDIQDPKIKVILDLPQQDYDTKVVNGVLSIIHKPTGHQILADNPEDVEI
jgi:hypothetical protein